MKKKVIDIFPPQRKGKKKTGKPQKLKTKLPARPFPKGLIFTFSVLIILGALAFFTLSKAKIEVWPETETLTSETKLIVGQDIPGKILTKEKTISGNFPASGKISKEEKAEGTLRVYNDYSASSQVLIANTRFVSVEGKLFRTPIKVTIPGGYYEKGKFFSGEADIRVVADEAGPEYNIGPSTFSIPGFAGSDKYTKFYAKSFQSMTGGFKEETGQITQKDLEGAENNLTERAKIESEIALRMELQKEEFLLEYNFIEKAVRTQVVETFPLAKAGQEGESFNFQAKAKSETLIFKKADFDNFVKNFILSQTSEGKALCQESLKVNSNTESIDLDSGKITLSLAISAKVYTDIDLSILKNGLGKKSLTEAKVFLEDEPGIIKAEVEFWPFWVKSAPDNSEKIEVGLRFD
ncbi:MAG: hypothetical protein ABIG08_00760 [bacterium]